MDEPRIVEREPLQLIGIEASFISIRSPDANSHLVIGPLWGRLFELRSKIPNQIGDEAYGAMYMRPEAERGHPHELQYVCGVPVSSHDEVPEGMVAHVVPGGTYVVLEHRGEICGIKRTIGRIYDDWLPGSGYRASSCVDLERYDERFLGDSPDSVMEYAVRVEPCTTQSD